MQFIVSKSLIRTFPVTKSNQTCHFLLKSYVQPKTYILTLVVSSLCPLCYLRKILCKYHFLLTLFTIPLLPEIQNLLRCTFIGLYIQNLGRFQRSTQPIPCFPHAQRKSFQINEKISLVGEESDIINSN